MDLARHKSFIYYGKLVELAKAEYPDRPYVQKAIAVSTGRRLDVVRMFTSEHDLPDLTSLVINQERGECGVGFTRSFDPKLARDEVFAFDWSAVTTDFDGFVKHTETVIKPRKPVSDAKALELMYAYYQNHRAAMPSTIRHSRDQIVELIMEGFSAEEAFGLMLQDGPTTA